MTGSSTGIGSDSSDNNAVYHNNLITNTQQVALNGGSNMWDNGYPSGGNYWSDYNGTDYYCGPYQNETGSDGIGDVPYVIDANNVDHYPLMHPYVQPSVDSWPMFHHDVMHTGYSTSQAPMTNYTLWSYNTYAPTFSSPAVVSGIVYVGSGNYRIQALNATTGALIWSYITGMMVPSSPAVVGGKVYAGSDDGNIYALESMTGALIWSRTIGANVYSSPAVDDNKVYVSSNDGNVYALDAASGELVWSHAAGVLESSPAIANGMVYIGSRNYNVYALNASNRGILCGATRTGG